MRITWVARSYLDYRCAVQEELDNLCGHQLTLITYKDVLPPNVYTRSQQLLGDRLIGLTGERRLGGKKSMTDHLANSGLRLTYQPGLVKSVLATKPDVMFADAFFQWSTAALWLRMTRKIPYVMGYERTAWVERNAQWYRKLARKVALPWIDGICANGSLCRDYLVSMGYPKEKILLGQMAADTQLLSQKCEQIDANQLQRLKDQYSLNGKIVYLYVGRVTHLKGVPHLLKAWEKFNAAEKNASLLIIGAGSAENEIKQHISDHKIPNVVFTGKIPYDQLHLYYALADCFVIATLEDNWSLVVPEAMSCGLPILCSKYNGCHPELVQESNGRVFDPLDTQSTADGLAYMWENRSRFSEMGQASREIVAGHSPRRAAETIYNACQMALDAKKKGRRR